MLLIDKLAYASALRNKKATYKVVGAVTMLLICVITRSVFVSLGIAIGMMGLTLVWGKTPLISYLKLFRIPVVFILLSTLAIAIDISKVQHGFLNVPIGPYYLVMSKASITECMELVTVVFGAISSSYFLILSTPMIDVLLVLKKWHTPNILIELMLLMYRYIFVLFAISEAIRVSQQCRLSLVDFKTRIKATSLAISATFVRAMQISNQLYDAMESRGFDGEIRVLEE